MNKKFIQTAVVTLGLTIFTLPLTACNTGTNNYMNPQRTGITGNENNTQFGSPVRFPARNDRINNNDTLLDSTDRTIAGTPAPGAQVPRVQAPGVQAPDTAFDNNTNNMREKSLTIKSYVENLPEVKDANVVVLGNTAVVACNPSTGTVNSTALRDAITQRVKSSDTSIKNVLVTESPDMMANLDQMFNNMTNRPMNEISRDFNQLVRQISPTTTYGR